MTKIYLRMNLIGFEMSSILLNFQDKYYEYGVESLEKGLSIRRYESVLLTYLVASYLV